MRIAVASGKGGTGKTTVATGLAYTAARQGRAVAYLDCDVEEPNGHLLLHPRLRERRVITRSVVWVDRTQCRACGRCEEACQFSAIVRVNSRVLTYPQLCHGCGACDLVCQNGAIRERFEEVGVIEAGEGGGIQFAHGVMHVGQAKCTPLIRAVKQMDVRSEVTIVDAPPGASCPVVETFRGVDLVLLVAEPTSFGLHDLGIVLEVVRRMGLPSAVVINRMDLGDGQLRRFCGQQDIPVLADLPEDPAVAQAYARGQVVPDCLPQYRPVFDEILVGLSRLVGSTWAGRDAAAASEGPVRKGGVAS